MANTSSALKAVKRFRVESIKTTAINLPHPKDRYRSPSSSHAFKTAKHFVETAGSKPPTLLNPFLPTKDARGNWHAPRYSLRVQKELVKKAKEAGMVGLLPPGPKMGENEIKKFVVEKSSVHIGMTADGEQEWWSKSVAWSQPPKPKKKASTPKKLAEDGQTVVVDDVEAQKGRKKLKAARKMMKKRVAIYKAKKAGLVSVYAGRKKLFKGHKWERTQDKRKIRRSILMRDMAKRIVRYKSFYRKRRPSPLAPPRTSAKNQKLPF